MNSRTHGFVTGLSVLVLAAVCHAAEEGITRVWNQFGGSPARNNVAQGKNIPIDFAPGEFDEKKGQWKKETSRHIKWVVDAQTQGWIAPLCAPVIADGKVFIGSNNYAGHVKRFPSSVGLSCLLCFNEADGKFLWQHSSEKKSPPPGVRDWAQNSLGSTPYVEGKRLWFITNRCELRCLDIEGFNDGENDGPYKNEDNENLDEADIVWSLDMIGQLGALPYFHNTSSVTGAGDLLFVCTGNGVDQGNINLPAPNAPSFIAVNKNTGKVVWTDNSPGLNILSGQWSSPAYGVLGGVPQVIFAGGDGWLYSFLADGSSESGKPKLLWKFDCNPKISKYSLGGRGQRKIIVAMPVIHGNLVYIGTGDAPEHCEGHGHLWCIDPTKRGDVSAELAFNSSDLENPIPHTRRWQAVDENAGEVARPNPNSAAVWHYTEFDTNGDGKVKFEETMHLICGTVVIRDGLLFVADFSGLVHCVDAKTGKPYWTHDLNAQCWGSHLIVDDKVLIGDVEGRISIFRLARRKELLNTIEFDTSICAAPVVCNNVLYIATGNHLFAIASDQNSKTKE